MSRIEERDLHTIENELRYTTIEEVQEHWDYDEGAFDEYAKEMVLWRLFTEQNPRWIALLQRHMQWNRKDFQEMKNFSIYWAHYQEDLMGVYNDIQRCIDNIEQQKDDIESGIEDAKSERDSAENKYYDLANKIESVTGDSGVPDISQVSRYIKVETQWKVDTSKIEDDSEIDEYDVGGLIDEMEDWKDDYHDQDEIVNDYEQLLETAKENLENAEQFQSEVEGWMYDY